MSAYLAALINEIAIARTEGTESSDVAAQGTPLSVSVGAGGFQVQPWPCRNPPPSPLHRSLPPICPESMPCVLCVSRRLYGAGPCFALVLSKERPYSESLAELRCDGSYRMTFINRRTTSCVSVRRESSVCTGCGPGNRK
jgi:hypothetical protein